MRHAKYGLNMDLQGQVRFLTGGMGYNKPEPATRDQYDKCWNHTTTDLVKCQSRRYSPDGRRSHKLFENNTATDFRRICLFCMSRSGIQQPWRLLSMEHQLKRESHPKCYPRGGVWFIALAAALWGISPSFRLVMLKMASLNQILLLEHFALCLYAFPILWIYRQKLRSFTWKQVGALLFISWGGSILAIMMFMQAYTHRSSNQAILLLQCKPLFAVILAYILLKEALPKRFLWTLLLGVSGVYLLTIGFHSPVNGIQNIFEINSLLALGASFLWGASTVMGRFLLNHMPYNMVASLRFVLSLPLLIMIEIWGTSDWNIPVSEWKTLLVFIIIQAFWPLVSALLYYRGLSTTIASHATIAELSSPMAGVLMNWITLKEIITTWQIVGFIFMWLAVYIISKQK